MLQHLAEHVEADRNLAAQHSFSSGAPPRYGTLVNSMPAAFCSIIPAKCSAEPAAGTP